MPTGAKTRDARRKREKYSAMATDEKAARLNQIKEREKNLREKRRETEAAEQERQEKVREQNRIRAKNYRDRKRAATAACNVPSTPNSKTKFIVDIIEKATPSTSAQLASSNIKKSRERDATNTIVEAASSTMRSEKSARKSLLPHLKAGNKKAVSSVLGISRNHFYYKPQKGKTPRTPQDVSRLVADFYQREDVVTVYPNKQRNGTVLRVLKSTRKRTYRKFKSEYDVKIGKTTFDKLKPRNVKLMGKARWLQCLCDVCDNVTMILRAVKSSMANKKINVPDHLADEISLAKSVVCDLKSIQCTTRKCKECSSDRVKSILSEWLAASAGEKVIYYKWCRVSETLACGKSVVKPKKVVQDAYVWELVADLQRQLVNFPYHTYNNIAQLHSFKVSKSQLKPHQVTVIADFAENYTCRQYAEAQSAYYSRNSVTIHPFVLIFSEGYEVKRESVVMVSADLRHDSAAVYSFMQQLSGHLAANHPTITELQMWSDGASSQYKSYLPMYNISRNFDITQLITWNFYGSRHGKGESDGESAVVKNHLDAATKSQQLILSNALDCYNELTSSDKSISTGASRRVFYYSTGSSADERRHWVSHQTICKVANVRSIHQVRPADSSTGISYRMSSCYCANIDACKHDIAANTWKTFLYPG